MAKDISSKLINLFKFIKEINIEKINLNFFVLVPLNQIFIA